MKGVKLRNRIGDDQLLDLKLAHDKRPFSGDRSIPHSKLNCHWMAAGLRLEGNRLNSSRLKACRVIAASHVSVPLNRTRPAILPR